MRILIRRTPGVCIQRTYVRTLSWTEIVLSLRSATHWLACCMQPCAPLICAHVDDADEGGTGGTCMQQNSCWWVEGHPFSRLLPRSLLLLLALLLLALACPVHPDAAPSASPNVASPLAPPSVCLLPTASTSHTGPYSRISFPLLLICFLPARPCEYREPSLVTSVQPTGGHRGVWFWASALLSELTSSRGKEIAATTRLLLPPLLLTHNFAAAHAALLKFSLLTPACAPRSWA